MQALFLDLCQFAVICSTTCRRRGKKMYIVTIKKMKWGNIYWKIFNSYHHTRSICRTMPSSIHFYYVNLFSPPRSHSRLDNFNQFPFKYQSKIYHSQENWTEQKGARERIESNNFLWLLWWRRWWWWGAIHIFLCGAHHTCNSFIHGLSWELMLSLYLSLSNHQYLFQPFLLVYLVMMMWL